MSSGLEQNDKREEQESGRKEGGGRLVRLYRGCSMRAFLPWMDAVVSLRVRDWVKRRRRGGKKEKTQQK